ncbi:MAG: hypothetical protein FP825_06525 [Hyphomonas sp.]|uniref:hypothetical protein n=1 Tax=Hyphomonas sp. TaxID=87 RepID=UPI0017BB1B3B|nr:hypothetical protein [Hyphomonas sp.]MBA3068115.1 hypothetical protein [Hyphomonas sp.]MBU3922435.1 hypothetical protein [Alphaproteobacteria bacterium]MBU4061458.1 hypothetical protein [Alphaproteobacteria bacterium]MBU4165026.1 hypothetical protein [Alphaproteobacteria bacterium]
MTSDPIRLLRIHRDGTVDVALNPDELKVYTGPKDRWGAKFRCQVVSTDDLAAELAGLIETLPWLRHVDRTRALRELIASGASRTILEHVGSTPVAAFGPTQWMILEVIRGQWETGEPFIADQLCADGGIVFEAALPFTLQADDALRAYLRTIPATDPRRRERVAVALGQHADGLSAD